MLIAGCGWLGSAVAAELVARGDRITGIRTDPGRGEKLRGLGVEPLILDLADPATGSRLPQDVDAVLALQAARGGGEASYRRAYLDANRTLLAWAGGRNLRAFVYTGSTGIFDQRDGGDVDETTRPAPSSPEGAVLLEAERALAEAATNGIPARVLRLSGLYGPGRLWLLDRVAKGGMALEPGDGPWMNVCHQDDAVQTLLAVLDRGRNGAVYHATDEKPMRRREAVTWVSGRLGFPLADAPSDPASPGPDRRILGARTRDELGLQLRWPELRKGLEPFLAQYLASRT